MSLLGLSESVMKDPKKHNDNIFTYTIFLNCINSLRKYLLDTTFTQIIRISVCKLNVRLSISKQN